MSADSHNDTHAPGWQQAPPTATPVAAASTKWLLAEFSSEKDEEEPEEMALEELEAKMSSVQEALERFDAVKVSAVMYVLTACLRR